METRKIQRKTFYAALQITDGRGKKYAYVLPISATDNLHQLLQTQKGLMAAYMCASRNVAEKFVNDWNAEYRAEGTYMFAEPLF